jgi:hypothetical protein
MASGSVITSPIVRPPTGRADVVASNTENVSTCRWSAPVRGPRIPPNRSVLVDREAQDGGGGDNDVAGYEVFGGGRAGV